MKNKKLNNITVIIPCFNEREALNSAVQSVLNQSILPDKIIIIDDASNDLETFKILDSLQENELIDVILCTINAGPGITRNIGIEASKSDWVLLLDSDDLLLDGAIEQLHNEINLNSISDFFFWNYKLKEINKKTEMIVSTKVVCEDESAKLDPYKLAKNFIIPGCSPFKKAIWTLNNGYDPTLSKGGVEDIDFWRRAIMNGAIGFHIDKTLYQWNRRESGNNSNIDEYKYILHRQKMLSYYDKFNPEYSEEIRPYIYRYYSARLMAKELNGFLKIEGDYFSWQQKLKAKIMFFKPFYIALRKTNNLLRI